MGAALRPSGLSSRSPLGDVIGVLGMPGAAPQVTGMLGAVHYCQSCDEPIVMEPDDGAARCPACGRLDKAGAVEPLFVVTGASGAGKTAILAPLAQLLAGRCVTFDVDWLLDAAGALSGDKVIAWPALRDAWLSVAHGVAQAGMPTVLLGQLVPDQLEPLPARRWIGEIHYLLLDCSDDVRRQRIECRPAWRDRNVNEQTYFGRWLRDNISDRIDTSAGTPEDTAEAVAAWVGQHLGPA
jgi:hypothetical protein